MTVFSNRSSASFENLELNETLVGMQGQISEQTNTHFDANEIVVEAEIQASWKSLFRFTAKQHISILIPATFLAICAGILKPIISIFLGHILDDLAAYAAGNLTEASLLEDVSKWCLALTGLGFGAWLLNGSFFALWLIFGELQAKNVRQKMFIGMLEKEMEWYDTRSDGLSPLLTRMQTQVRELQLATSQPAAYFLEDCAAAATATGIAFYYSWKLTLVILTSIPVLGSIMWLITRNLQPAIELQKEQLTEASKLADTAIKFVDTVKAFNGREQETHQYKQAINAAAMSYLVQAAANARQIGAARFILIAMFVAGFWYGMILVNQGTLTAGSVLTTFYSCLMANEGVEALIPQWLVLAKGMSAGETLKRVQTQMERGRKITKMVGSTIPKSCYGDIEVSNVSFSYPSNPRQQVLNNASFFFPAGETTFVIGKSGSGKSTLSNLLLRFYEPSSGGLYIDGEAIQTLDTNWLRNNITLIQQKSVLFNETMFRNIAFGRRSHEIVTKDDVRLACQTALLQETINNLPNGLDTKIGTGGNTMSGGQKQRVAIARARLRDSPILILDEATSALDPVSRSMVMEAIRQWRRGRTTIIITHEIPQILDNDFVYLLHDGQVVEEGYRRQLAENPFSFFRTFLGPSTASTPSAAASTPEARTSNESNRSTQESAFRDDDSFNSNLRNTTNRLRHVSKFLGINDECSLHGQGRSRRMSFGMASAHANVLRAENIWTAPNQRNHQADRKIDVSKPLPSMPNPSSRRGSVPHPILRRASLPLSGLLPTQTPQGYELMQLMGSKTVESRAGQVKLDRKRALETEITNSDPNDDYLAIISRKKIQTKSVKGSSKKVPAIYKKPASLKQILGTVWPLLSWRDRTALIAGFIFAFINAAATPAFSYSLAKLLNTFYMTVYQSEEARKWALCILGIAVIDGFTSCCFHYYLEYCGRVWVDTLRVQALTRILAQPRAWFDKEKNKPERLTECLDRNAEEMRNLVGRFAGYVFLAGSMVSIAIIWAFLVCWKLTLVGIASAPVMYVFTRIYETVSSKWESKTNQMATFAADVFAETFSNIRVVRALTLENYFKLKHDKATMKAYKVGLRRATWSGVFFGLSDSTNSFVTALILYYGAVLVGQGQFTTESVIAAITLLLFSSGNANNMMSFIPQINSSRTTAAHMLYLANLPHKASHEARGIRRLATPFPIRLHNLSFTYPNQPDIQILHKISLTFESNSCTALVGSSGSGKSTIASLLLGIYPPNEPLNHPNPSISFAGTSIFDCHMASLRNIITIVSQSPVIFPTTIAANITYGLPYNSPFLSDGNIEHAARMAGIHDFITSLPLGYRTLIGEGGQGLSGGQSQRIAIARALVRRPQVLILDEATSALDVESRNLIRDTVRSLTSARQPKISRRLNESQHQISAGTGMAVIIITHSLEMMRVAREIVVLDQGRVVEQGSFEELKQRRGAFARLISGGEWVDA